MPLADVKPSRCPAALWSLAVCRTEAPTVSMTNLPAARPRRFKNDVSASRRAFGQLLVHTVAVEVHYIERLAGLLR